MFCCRKAIRHSENADWSLNVLEVLLASVIKCNVEFIADLSVGIVGNADAARFRNGLKACRYIDPVTEYVPVIFDNITDIDTDPELNSIVWRYV